MPSPAVIATASVTPVTWTGVTEQLFPPWHVSAVEPAFPREKSLPQHSTMPPWMIAHAKSDPAAIAVALLRPVTLRGATEHGF